MRLRDGDDCFYCGRVIRFEDEPNVNKWGHFTGSIAKANASLEHLIDKKYEGNHALWNLVLAPRKCNARRNHMNVLDKLATRYNKEMTPFVANVIKQYEKLVEKLRLVA